MELQPDHRGMDNQRSRGLRRAQTTGGGRRRGRTKPRATQKIPQIFGGRKETKPITLACYEPSKGRARFALRSSENTAKELNCKSLYLTYRLDARANRYFGRPVHRTGRR